MKKVFKVLALIASWISALIASWISQRDRSNKQPEQASINSWPQPGLAGTTVLDNLKTDHVTP